MHVRAEDVVTAIKTALNDANLLYSKLIMIGNDGSSVNKKMFNLFTEEEVRERGAPLDVGFCNIHAFYNGFLKGLSL